MVRFMWVLGMVLVLASCGSSDSGKANSAPRPEPPPQAPVFPPDTYERFGQCHAGCFYNRSIPRQVTADAQRMPTVEHLSAARIDVGIAQSHIQPNQLPVIGKHGSTDIRYGQLADGTGSVALANYFDDALGTHPRQGSVPLIHFGGAASQENIDRLIHAVQLVNTGLPPEWKIKIPSSEPTLVNPRSGIYVEFIPTVDWPHARHVLGIATSYPGRNDRLVQVQGIEDARQAVATLAHELIHVLGFDHVSIGPDSLMEGHSNEHYLNILHGIDRDALRVFYGRMDGDRWPVDFGPWSSTSTHLHGSGGSHVGFGVTLRNGYVEPWAYGPIAFVPGSNDLTSNLADNPNLTGTATWTGRLLGFADESPVAGSARIDVSLATLTGRADFTALEQWDAGTAPGELGTGAQWSDGDLEYSIVVSGNTFKETGGDAGILTGIFTGENHMGAAGTLERQDLTAAFGASR